MPQCRLRLINMPESGFVTVEPEETSGDVTEELQPLEPEVQNVDSDVDSTEESVVSETPVLETESSGNDQPENSESGAVETTADSGILDGADIVTEEAN